MPSKIIINNLVGLPASGKTTYCHNIIRHLSSSGGGGTNLSALHICYDHFIPAVSQETFKRDRFRMRLLLQSAIDDIRKGKGFSATESLALHLFSVHFPIPAAAAASTIIILIDDNMYYKSMRKEMWNVARSNGTAYFCTYFPISLERACERNRLRDVVVPPEHIQRMNERLEVPNDDVLVVAVDDGEDFIRNKLLNLLEQLKPLSLAADVQQQQQPPPPSSVLHQIDLMLRKEVGRKLAATHRRHRDVAAKILCDQRKFVLNECRNGNISIADVDELKLLIGL